MPLDQVKPPGWGLDLGTESTQNRGRLTRASGVRYLERGTIMSRSGRKRVTNKSLAPLYPNSVDSISVMAQTEGVAVFMDERRYTAPAATPEPEIAKLLYKAGGTLYLRESDDVAAQVLAGLDAGYKMTTANYSGITFVVDSHSKSVAVRRKPAADQTVGNRVLYEAVEMGIRFPTTNDKPTLTDAGGGSINPSTDPFEAQQAYRVRIGWKDKYDRSSNPSLPSTTLYVAATSQNRKLLVDWTSIPIPTDATEAQLWLSLSVSGTQTSYVLIPVTNLSAGKFLRSDGAYNGTCEIASLNGSESWPTLEGTHGWDHGHPPRATDMLVINDTSYLLAAQDVIYREILPTADKPLTSRPRPQTTTSWGAGQGMPNTRRPPGGPQPGPWMNPQPDVGAKVEAFRVDSSYLFVGKPLFPEYYEFYTPVGDGAERGIGLAKIGDACAIFTDQNVWIYDPSGPSLKKTPAGVGCLSRDSIVEVTGGVIFLGSDSSFYFFNGATVVPIANELLPLFTRDDYPGLRFDKTRANEVHGTYSAGRIYYTIPTIYGGRLLAVGDRNWGGTQWSIDDTYDYRQIDFLPDQNVILGVDSSRVGQSYFFYLETGVVDEMPWPPGGVQPPDRNIFIDFEAVLLVAGELEGRLRRIGIDRTDGGALLNATVTIDAGGSFAHSITFAIPLAGRRDEWRQYLPGNFLGRFVTVRIFGSTFASRVSVYDIKLLGDRVGEF